MLTPSRNGKLTLLDRLFPRPPDPDRGLALAAITGDLDIAAVKPAMLRELVPSAWTRCCSAIPTIMSATSPKPCRWSGRKRRGHRPLEPRADARRGRRRTAGGEPLRRAERAGRGCSTAPASPARFAIIKLVTGGLRIGVSARLAKQALADLGKVDVAEIEELWHGLHAAL